jgi:hypothetical protein
MLRNSYAAQQVFGELNLNASLDKGSSENWEL